MMVSDSDLRNFAVNFPELGSVAIMYPQEWLRTVTSLGSFLLVKL